MRWLVRPAICYGFILHFYVPHNVLCAKNMRHRKDKVMIHPRNLPPQLKIRNYLSCHHFEAEITFK